MGGNREEGSVSSMSILRGEAPCKLIGVSKLGIACAVSAGHQPSRGKQSRLCLFRRHEGQSLLLFQLSI